MNNEVIHEVIHNRVLDYNEGIDVGDGDDDDGNDDVDALASVSRAFFSSPLVRFGDVGGVATALREAAVMEDNLDAGPSPLYIGSSCSF